MPAFRPACEGPPNAAENDAPMTTAATHPSLLRKGLRKAVFWDRDGTLMREVDYCSSPSEVEAIEGAGAALAALRAAGWLHVLVTNQSGIGRGLFSQQDYEAVNAELFRQLGLVPDGVYFCPETPEHATSRRKPGTQMVEEACTELGIDPSASWFVGDKNSDIQCGLAAGCRTILVLTGYGTRQLPSPAHTISADAAAAAQFILSAQGLRSIH